MSDVHEPILWLSLLVAAGSFTAFLLAMVREGFGWLLERFDDAFEE